MHFIEDPAFWVAIAFIGFVGVFFYFKVHALIAKALDERADKIRRELDEAQKLREGAQALFADYQRKTRNVEKEADDIIAFAKKEAARQAEKAKKDLEDLIARRTAMAESKIAQAEAQAVQDVRNAAVDLAVAAAERLLAAEMRGDKANALIDRSVADLKGKLH